MTIPPWQDPSLQGPLHPPAAYDAIPLSPWTRRVTRLVGWLCLSPLLYAGGWLLLFLVIGPTTRIADYVYKINQGHLASAYAAWTPTTGLPTERAALVETRRALVTADLQDAGVDENFRVLAAEHWITCCCEPRLTTNPNEADFDRLLVRFTTRQGQPLDYVFDVRRDRRDCAGFTPLPPQWTLYEAYPLGVEPLRLGWSLSESLASLPAADMLPSGWLPLPSTSDGGRLIQRPATSLWSDPDRRVSHGQGPLYQLGSTWYARVGDEWVIVYVGGQREGDNGPALGIMIVETRSVTGWRTFTRQRTVRTAPAAGGAWRIVATEGRLLTLEDERGTRWTVDALAAQGSPLPPPTTPPGFTERLLNALTAPSAPPVPRLAVPPPVYPTPSPYPSPTTH